MKLYDSVVIICDDSPKMSQDVSVIRAALEAFGLRVHLYHLEQKRNALDVLAGDFPEGEYIILCCHGWPDAEGVPQVHLEVRDQVDSDYGKCGGWEQVTVTLTPANIPDYFRGNGRTLISIACGSGQQPLAQAFLRAGFKAYIAPCGPGAHINSVLLFIIGFFYHLLAASRLEDEPLHHTDQEAVSLASQADSIHKRGTLTFHYFS